MEERGELFQAKLSTDLMVWICVYSLKNKYQNNDDHKSMGNKGIFDYKSL